MSKSSHCFSTRRSLLCISVLASLSLKTPLVNAQLPSQNLAQQLEFEVTAPKASAELEAGESFSITWSSKPAVFDEDDLVDITLKSYIKPAVGSQWQFDQKVGEAQAGAGFYDWIVTDNNTLFTIPQKQIAAHQITVRAFAGKYAYKCTSSTDLFSIKPKPPEIPVEREKALMNGPVIVDPFLRSQPGFIQSTLTTRITTLPTPSPPLGPTTFNPSSRITTVVGETTFNAAFKLSPSTTTSNNPVLTSTENPDATTTSTPDDNDKVVTFFQGKMSSGKYFGIILGVIFPVFAVLAFVMYCIVRRKREKAAKIPRHARFPFCCFDPWPETKYKRKDGVMVKLPAEKVVSGKGEMDKKKPDPEETKAVEAPRSPPVAPQGISNTHEHPPFVARQDAAVPPLATAPSQNDTIRRPTHTNGEGLDGYGASISSSVSLSTYPDELDTSDEEDLKRPSKGSVPASDSSEIRGQQTLKWRREEQEEREKRQKLKGKAPEDPEQQSVEQSRMSSDLNSAEKGQLTPDSTGSETEKPGILPRIETSLKRPVDPWWFFRGSN
ncbi:hypothetical protein BJ508DRAFT_328314 [Ascobolus immersus RN42]|uniref:Uncharacterized protein n=1 Tax=Ascobolus immersus RN42 TaxID=1160509 RepID=A0A3N4HZX4_ASCIM|nr:hypothetical protein BJ508DRAFT_328314 [Ascobolus immersus RN42]